MTEEGLLTVRDVADRTGKTLSQVYRLIHRGDLVTQRVRIRNNTQYRVREEDLAAFIASGGGLSSPRVRGRIGMLGVPEVALRLGFSVETVRKMCHEGGLEAYRGGTTARGHFRIPESAIERLKVRQ